MEAAKVPAVNAWVASVARLIVPAVKVAAALVSALNCVLAVSRLLAWVDPTNVPPVRTSVAAAALDATASPKVAVAGVPPKLSCVEDNKPVETPMVLLPEVLPSLKKTLRVLFVNTCPPLKLVVEPMLSISALMD